LFKASFRTELSEAFKLHNTARLAMMPPLSTGETSWP
jgi:hypothetical protein